MTQELYEASGRAGPKGVGPSTCVVHQPVYTFPTQPTSPHCLCVGLLKITAGLPGRQAQPSPVPQTQLQTHLGVPRTVLSTFSQGVLLGCAFLSPRHGSPYVCSP